MDFPNRGIFSYELAISVPQLGEITNKDQRASRNLNIVKPGLQRNDASPHSGIRVFDISLGEPAPF